MSLPFSAEEPGGGFLSVSKSGDGIGVWPRRGWKHLAPPCPELTLRTQAELATSHKCLSHEVKRLTEENQGLRAEQPPPAAPRVLEQDEGREEALPSSVPVRAVPALRARCSPCWRFLFITEKLWPGTMGLGGRSRLLF